MKKIFFTVFSIVSLAACGDGKDSPVPQVEGRYVLSQAVPSDCQDIFGTSVQVNQNDETLTIPQAGGGASISGTVDGQGRFQISGQVRAGLDVVHFTCAGSFQNESASLQCGFQENPGVTCSLTYRRSASGSSGATGVLTSPSSGGAFLSLPDAENGERGEVLPIDQD